MLGYLVYLLTTTRRGSGGYAHARECVVGHEGYRFFVTVLIPQASPRQVSLPSVCHAPLCGPHRPPPKCRREKVCEDSGVLRHGSRGQGGDPRRRVYGKFTGILQGKLRQEVSSVHRLRSRFCEGTMRECVSRDPQHNRHATQHRRLSCKHRSDLRRAYYDNAPWLLRSPTS